MTPTRIVNARLPHRSGHFAFHLGGGKIQQVTPQPAANENAGADDLDARGGIVTASLVDCHLHLDLAYTLDTTEPNRSGTLLEAIGIWSQAKLALTPEDVRRRAVTAIQAEVGFGTGFIRSHVDVASTAGLRLTRGVLEARRDMHEQCEIQLVAFPQDGLIRDPGAKANIEEAVRLGVDRIGGIPHFERTAREGIQHLEAVFDIAARLDKPIDVHIDETDDADSKFTEHLAALTIERGFQGRVTASHVCALASYSDVHAARVIDLLAEARVSVVTNPGVNLHLQGRFDRYPKRRGLTRVSELLDRGVDCAAGQDCIRDVFYPLGNGNMLDQAFLLVHADHMGSPKRLHQAFDMVCDMAARVAGRKHHGVEAGAAANLAVFPVETVDDLVRERPRPRAVLRAGNVVVG